MSGLDVLAAGAKWIVREVPGLAGPGMRRSVRCETCGAGSPVAEDDLRPVTVWAMAHTRDNPQHNRMVMTARQRWCILPRTVPPPPAPMRDPAPQRAKPHSAPRTRRRPSLAGPLVMVGLVFAMGAFLVTLGV